MDLVKFIIENEDWESKLRNPPYYLKIKKEDPNLYLFSYDSKSRNELDIVADARGIILEIVETPIKTVKIVCNPFKRFFHYNEKLDFDWDSAIAYVKHDGSCLKRYWHNGEFHWATLNTIKISNDAILNKGRTYKELAEELIKDDLNIDELKDYTLLFEYCSIFNRVLVYYPQPQLYLIGVKHNTTGEEMRPDDAVRKWGLNLPIPEWRRVGSFNECKEMADKADMQCEGFVVVDKNFNRFKIKGKAYMKLLRNKAGNDNLLTYIKKNISDDYVGHNPKYRETEKRLREMYNAVFIRLEMGLNELEEYLKNNTYNIKLRDKVRNFVKERPHYKLFIEELHLLSKECSRKKIIYRIHDKLSCAKLAYLYSQL